MVRLKPLFREDDQSTPERALHKCQSVYLLKPDNRFLVAVSDVHSILTGEETKSCSADFDGEKWTVTHDKVRVGVLSKRHGFNDYVKLLTDFAATLMNGLPGRHGPSDETGSGSLTEQRFETAEKADLIAVEKEIESFAPSALIAAVSRLAARRRAQGKQMQGKQPAPDRERLALYARALSALYEQELDLLDTSDSLAGRVLALSTIAVACRLPGSERCIARTAESFGYHKEAEALAMKLADDDALKAYIERKDETLKRIAQGRDGDVEARYLYLKRLMENDRTDESAKWFKEHFAANPAMRLSIAALNAEKELQTLPDIGVSLIDEITGKAFESVNGDGDAKAESKPASAETVLPWRAKLNRLLETIERPNTGSLFSANLTRAFYRAFAYSDFYTAVAGYSRTGSQSEERFKHAFEINERMPMSSIESWALGIWHTRNGKYNVTPMARQLSHPGSYGARARALTAREIARWFPSGDPKALHAGRIFFERADSRPSTRAIAAGLARDILIHPSLARELNQSVLEASGNDGSTVEPGVNAIVPDEIAASLSLLSEKAKSMWFEGKHEEAGKLIRSYPWMIQKEDWKRFIAPAFFEVLADSPRDAARATQVLSRKRFTTTDDIGQIFDYFAEKGKPQLAFDLSCLLLDSAYSGQELRYLDMASTAYGYLKKARGDREAAEWIAARVPPQFLNPFSEFALRHGHYELLFSIIPKSPEGIGSEHVWLLRAAAWRAGFPVDAEMLNMMQEHFSKAGSDPTFLAGKMLASKGGSESGKSADATLVDEPMLIRQMSDAAYFLGWNAEFGGDIDRAGKWYHLSLETAVNKGFEISRAVDKLKTVSPDRTKASRP